MVRISTLYSLVTVELIICVFLAILVLISIIIIPIYLRRMAKEIAQMRKDINAMSEAHVNLVQELTTMINNRKGGFDTRV